MHLSNAGDVHLARVCILMCANNAYVINVFVFGVNIPRRDCALYFVLLFKANPGTFKAQLLLAFGTRGSFNGKMHRFRRKPQNYCTFVWFFATFFTRSCVFRFQVYQIGMGPCPAHCILFHLCLLMPCYDRHWLFKICKIRVRYIVKYVKARVLMTSVTCPGTSAGRGCPFGARVH